MQVSSTLADIKRTNKYYFKGLGRRLVCCLAITASVNLAIAQESGITDTTIQIGGVMDLQGDSSGLGEGMKAGIEAALKGEQVQGRTIEFTTLNDFYDPNITAEATKELVEQNIFAMVGNVGTPTARASLPILAENGIPAVGFFTGAGLLRPGQGDIINYRASYSQEIASLIKAALAAGVKPPEVCAFVQNDAYGMSGVQGLKAALLDNPEAESIIPRLDEVLGMEGDYPVRNGLGPVGTYERNTLQAREGYRSLKEWEEVAGTRCRLVVTVGSYRAVGAFISYSRLLKKEDWIFSGVSFTGADALKTELEQNRVAERVIVTQVVPSPDAELPIVQAARAALGQQLNFVSLEGYIVGRMFLQIMQNIDGSLTQENFLQAVRGKTFDLGGVSLDFTDDNQGSDLVIMTYLRNGEYDIIAPESLGQIFAQ